MNYKDYKHKKIDMIRLLLFSMSILISQCSIILEHLLITQANQTFTLPFTSPFQKFPIFAVFIETANIQNSEFSLTYDTTKTVLTSTQLTINFLTLKSNSFSSESIQAAVLITDEQSSQFSIGVKIVNITSLMNFTFPGLTLVQNNASRGLIQIYSLSFPMVYNETLDYSSSNVLSISMNKSSTTYTTNVYFSYIYFTSNYLGQNVLALFRQINQTISTYFIVYQPFAYTPSSSNVMFAIRQYHSTTIPFINCPFTNNYNYMTGTNWQVMVGYTFSSGTPATFHSDVFFFNSSFSGCPYSKFLFYVQLYQSLPYSCIPCHSSCRTCSLNSTTSLTSTDANYCLSCTWLGYLNATADGNGNCICLPGIQQINGVCQECEQACLRFTVDYMETQNQSNFLLTYSYALVVQTISLQTNLIVYLNGVQINFNANQQQNSYYIIGISLSDMSQCEGDPCSFLFQIQHPELVFTPDYSKTLCMNNVTLSVDNYVDYYSAVPSSLQSAFQILGIAIGMAFTGGYTSLVTILFELEQLIDVHRYLSLKIPIIFNQLLASMAYFRFLSILNLLPYEYSQKIQDVVPQDLDNFGPPRIRYYQNGLNYYKNTIAGFITVFSLLAINYILYRLLRILPFKATKKLATKIRIRKFITVHDTLEQMELPCIFFAFQQFQVVLRHPQLYWIYGFAMLVCGIILIFPFLVVLYVYFHKDETSNIDIFEDLLQDNLMSQKVTYIYYIFNYYRKIIFAMCLLSIFPGLIQIYMLIILNSLHLAFQIYLVVARTYKSKMKIVIRFINDICIITIQILILIYNLNDYSKAIMINIGMACLYLALVTTIMGILDVIVKIIDTCRQELRSKRQEESTQQMKKIQILREFKNEIRCHIGEQLQQAPKDLKQIKFLEDKELMENTFNKEDEQSDVISIHLQNHRELEANDLVFIEQDWEDIYPVEPSHFKPKLHPSKQLIKQQINLAPDIELYEFPQEVTQRAKQINHRRKAKLNKYEGDFEETNPNNKNQLNHIKLKQTKEIHRQDLLIIQDSKEESQHESQSVTDAMPENKQEISSEN